MKLETRPISTIRPYDRNPRITSEKAVKDTAQSIMDFGWNQPIVIDKDGVIICGHTRYRAAKYLNLAEIPCVIADELTEEQARAYRIADNKTAERSGWNFDLLPDEIAPIEDLFDFTKLGFDRDELDKVMGKCIYARDKDPDKIPDEIPTQPITKHGEIITLGEHRLICGDSTKPETYAALMGEEKADIVITDPPYGVEYKGGPKKERTEIENDEIRGDDLRAFLTAAFRGIIGAGKQGAPVYIWCASGNIHHFIESAVNAGLTYREELIWKKTIPNLGWADYLYQHEPCLYCKIPGAATFWNGGRDQKTVIDEQKDPKDMSEKELRAEVKHWRRITQIDVIREKMPDKSPLHPTTKPTRLYTRFLHNSSRRGEIFLDAFGGSGTAVIAAEQTHRRARVIEIDPRYCDTIVTRWEDFTGGEAKRQPPENA